MWALSLSILSSIIGSASSSWFKDTKLGIYFYAKLDQLYIYTANKFHLKILSDEEAWKQQYPNIASEMQDIKNRLKELENKNV
jgi:hypothetical protein